MPFDPRYLPQRCWFCRAVEGVAVTPEPGERDVVLVTGCDCAPRYLVVARFWIKAAPHLTPTECGAISTLIREAAGTHLLPRVDHAMGQPRVSTSSA